MARTAEPDPPQQAPRFLEELEKREQEQTPRGRQGAEEADTAVAELVARFSDTPERRQAIGRALRRAADRMPSGG